MQRNIIPAVIDGKQELCSLPPDATAQQAARLLRDRHVGAVLVVDGRRLVGIVTERDLVFRLLAPGREAADTRLADIMTASPETLAPDDTAAEALEKMRKGRYRHLPVLDGDQLVGMVSIRDLYEAVRATLQEQLKSAEALIYGDQYGTG